MIEEIDTFITDNFPKDFEPRSNQIEALHHIGQVIGKKKVIIVHAPTGSGKSFIAQTIANSTRKCHEDTIKLIQHNEIFKSDWSMSECWGCTTLTVTKNLQDQYVELFDDIIPLKGQNNYVCDIDDNFTVDVAPCKAPGSKLKKQCIECNECTFYNTVKDVYASNHSTLNYNKFFSQESKFKKRQVIVCDEASEIEQSIVSCYTCRIPHKLLKHLGRNIPKQSEINTRSKALSWINSVEESITETIKELNSRAKISYLRNVQNSIAQTKSAWDNGEYVVEFQDNYIEFIPVRIDGIFNREIASKCETVVLMSATFIDLKKYIKMLGIKEEDVEIVECESTFDSLKAPIVHAGDFYLNRENVDRNMNAIMKMVLHICENHKGQKGLIHTQTLKFASALQRITDKIPDKLNHHYLYRQGDVMNEQLLATHSESDEPTILVSPSMTHGVDLKGDLASFQIVLKAPYASLADKRTKTLFDRDKDWYTNKMISNFIQQCGRGVRSEDDECITYVLDGVLINQIIKNSHKLPKHFLDRLV